MYKFFSLVYNSIRGVRMKKTYTIIVHKEEDGFWGECKEIEGCFAQAKTIEELKRMMAESIYLYFNNDKDIDEADTKNIKLEVAYA
nr:MAG TPA: putative nuclease [Caudoviricetes sp.]